LAYPGIRGSEAAVNSPRAKYLAIQSLLVAASDSASTRRDGINSASAKRSWIHACALTPAKDDPMLRRPQSCPPIRRLLHQFHVLAFLLTLAGLLGAKHVGAAEPVPDVLGASIRISPEDFTAEPVGIYSVISMRGADRDRNQDHVGDPELPVFVEFLLLPPDHVVENVEVIPVARHELPGRYLPFPILPSDRPEEGPPDSPTWLPRVYPDRPGMLIQDGPMRRYWLAKLAIWPIEYDAERMSITILTEVQVRIRTRALTAEEHASTLHISRPDGIDGPFG